MKALSLPAILLAAAFLLALRPTGNNDLWWHLETGRWMVEHQRLPIEDPFSYTGFMRPWHDVEWLAELGLYGVWSVAGEAGLVVLAALLLTLAFACVRALARITSGSDGIAALLLVLAVVHSRYWWAPRPTLASDLCALGTLLCLERYRRGGGDRLLWLLPAIAALWANLHGGFILAPILVGTVAGAAVIAPYVPSLAPEGWTARQRKRLVLAALLVPLAVLVNANGTAVLSQSLQMFHASAYRHLVDEWTWPEVRFVAAVWCTVLSILVASRRPLRLSTLGLALGLSALATSAHRFELYFGLLVLPVLAEHLVGRSAVAIGLLALSGVTARIHVVPAYVPALLALASIAGDRVRLPARATLPRGFTLASSRSQALAGVALAAVLVAGFRREQLRLDVARYPRRAIAFLEEQRAQHVFNLYAWGGWLLFTSDVKTFIDGRSWGTGNFPEYVAALGPGYREVFSRYDVRFTLLPPGEMIHRFLSEDRGWERVYADDQALIFRRREVSAPGDGLPAR